MKGRESARVVHGSTVQRGTMRSAEQRCPALWKAEARISRTACSGSALESAIMALRPPVSAMKGTMAPRRSASAF